LRDAALRWTGDVEGDQTKQGRKAKRFPVCQLFGSEASLILLDDSLNDVVCGKIGLNNETSAGSTRLDEPGRVQ
jgi:hypothetical protein